MKAEAIQHRKPGRPATLQDKHGCPVPVRADRDRAIRRFFQEIPLAALDEPLLGSGDPRFYRLQDALHDDAYRNTSPGTLCRKFGISWLDLMRLWLEYCVMLAKIELANRWPDIARDIAENALPKMTPCPDCHRRGGLPDQRADASSESRTCLKCNGTGEVRVPGDRHAINFIAKFLGFTGQRTPVVVVQQTGCVLLLEATLAGTAKIIGT